MHLSSEGFIYKSFIYDIVDASQYKCTCYMVYLQNAVYSKFIFTFSQTALPNTVYQAIYASYLYM